MHQPLATHACSRPGSHPSVREPWRDHYPWQGGVSRKYGTPTTRAVPMSEEEDPGGRHGWRSTRSAPGLACRCSPDRRLKESTILTLSRNLGEVVVIGTGAGQVRVTVIDIDRGRVRLGFEADRSVPIFRSELLPCEPPASDGRV